MHTSANANGHVKTASKGGRHRRPKESVNPLRPIVFGRAVAPSTAAGSARYVGRVGALAVALGVGAAVASMPVAYADRQGSDGSTGTSSASESSDASSTAGPARGSGPSARRGANSTAPESVSTPVDVPAVTDVPDTSVSDTSVPDTSVADAPVPDPSVTDTAAVPSSRGGSPDVADVAPSTDTGRDDPQTSRPSNRRSDTADSAGSDSPAVVVAPPSASSALTC